MPFESVEYRIEVAQRIVSGKELGRIGADDLRSRRSLSVWVTARQRDSSLPVGQVLTLHMEDGRYLRGAFREGRFVATSDIEGP